MTAQARGRAFHAAVAAIVAGSPRPFDWHRDCLSDVERVFLPVAGPGRGKVVEPFVCIRCGLESWTKLHAHRPLNSGIRTCGGTMCRQSDVERIRDQENKRFVTEALRMAEAEAGFSHPPPIGGYGLWQQG